MNLRLATELSVRAFAAGRSATHPYLATWESGVWVMRDGPGKKGKPRKIEVASVELAPKDVIKRIQELNLGWHFLCAAYEDNSTFAETREAFKALGYRALATEWFFAHSLEPDAIPELESVPPVRLVGSEEQHAAIKQHARQPRRFRGGSSRQYAIWDAETDYGWVHSVPEGPDNWVSDLFVYEEFRGRGYGKALMSRLLRDDLALGVRSSVLVASAAGRKIYPQVGYKEIGVMHVLCPAKR